MDAVLHTEPVDGAPRQPGERVRVVAATDPSVYDVSPLIGSTGRVAALDYQGLVGDSAPGDPLILVDLDSGAREAFWREELAGEGDAA